MKTSSISDSNSSLLHELLQRLKLATIKYHMDPITRLMNTQFSSAKIKIQDDADYIAEQEFLKRTYSLQQFPLKIQLLSQYYKYHTEAPRFFMPEIGLTMEENYAQKREIEYLKVTNKIKQQNNREEEQIIEPISTSNVLDGLSFSIQSIKEPLDIPSNQPQKKLVRMVSLHSDEFSKKQPKEGHFINKKTLQNQCNIPKFKTIKEPKKTPKKKQVKLNQVKKIIQKLTKKENNKNVNREKTRQDLIIKHQQTIKGQLFKILAPFKTTQSLKSEQKKTTKQLVRSKSNAATIFMDLRKGNSSHNVREIGQNTKNIKVNSIQRTLFKGNKLTKMKNSFNFECENTKPDNHKSQQKQQIDLKKFSSQEKTMFKKIIQVKKR